MTRLATKTLSGIERRMAELDEGSIRYRILMCAKNFKLSWIDLGQSLYTVSKDKLYREWGYATFESYIAKEIGIKKTTAVKLLKSYYFLEKEEPVYLQNKHDANVTEVASVPSYESVNLLRLAKNNKGLDESEYRALKNDVFRSGKDAGEVRKSLTAIMRQREKGDPEEARQKRRTSVLKRFAATLKALKTEIETSKILPASLLKETASLISKIEAEIG